MTNPPSDPPMLKVSGTSVKVYGSTTQFQTFGLAPRNNAYIGRTLTVYFQSTTSGVTQGNAAIGHDRRVELQRCRRLDDGYGGGAGFHLRRDADFVWHRRLFVRFTAGLCLEQCGPVQAVPFTIYPLIYSAGPNKTYGIVTDFDSPIHYTWEADQWQRPPTGFAITRS